MLVRLQFVSPLLVCILALGCTNAPEGDGGRGATALGAGDGDANPVAQSEEDGPADESALDPQAALPGGSPDDRYGADGTKFVAFQSDSGEPAPKPDGEPEEAEPVTPPASDPDITLLAEAIAELRASIEQLQKQNRQIMVALAINDQDAGPELTDPSGAGPAGTEPPEGSLAYTVLDLREAVEYLALEQEAMRKMIDHGTTVMKPVAPTHGSLVIENNTDSDQHVWVNGAAHWVWARTNATLSVPVGEITTKLTGESAKTWEIKEPDYSERIEFVQQ